MIESIFNVIGLAAEGILVAAAGHRTMISKDRAWGMLLLFYAALFLGNLYWSVYLLFYGMTPKYFYVSETTWYAGYLFLLLTVKILKQPVRSGSRPAVLYLVPVFIIACGIFFTIKGSGIIDNIVSECLMGLIMWNSLEEYLFLRSRPQEEQERLPFFLAAFLFAVITHLLWISSCFWVGDTLNNPYFWIETVQMINIFLLFFALRKAVDE